MYYGSLPEIALAGASKLALTYFTLYYRSVHKLYAKIHGPLSKLLCLCSVQSRMTVYPR